MSTTLRAIVLSTVLILAGCARGDQSSDEDSMQERVTRIVFFGDSITEAGAQPGGYVTLVADSLGLAYPDRGIEVIGAGISGNKVPDLAARLERDVLSVAPTHVVIYIGVNDVWHHFAFDHNTGTAPDVFEQGLQDLIMAMRGAGAEVLLCTPSVIGEDPRSEDAKNQRLMEYAEISRAVAEMTNARLCDLRAAFEEYLLAHNEDKVEQGVLTTDGVHLNAVGNRFVADFMLRHLHKVLAP